MVVPLRWKRHAQVSSRGVPVGGLAPGRAMDWYGNAGYSIANRDTASSFHSSPTPGTSLGIARPSEIASGCERIGAAQSTYSRKWAVGVTARTCALTSG